MRKLVILVFASLMFFVMYGCDDSSSPAPGSLKLTITNDTAKAGIVTCGIDTVFAESQGFSPDANCGILTTVAAGDVTQQQVVITVDNIPPGEYYVSGILEVDPFSLTSGLFGNKCASEPAPYFIYDEKTELQTGNTVTIVSGETAEITEGFTDAKIATCAK